MTQDPVKRDQSKHVDTEGRLRYSADGSEVFPGPTGVRRCTCATTGSGYCPTHTKGEPNPAINGAIR